MFSELTYDFAQIHIQHTRKKQCVCRHSYTHVTHTPTGTARRSSFHEAPADSFSNYYCRNTRYKGVNSEIAWCDSMWPMRRGKIDSVSSDRAPSRDYLSQDAAVSEHWAMCQTRKKVNVVQC